MRSTSLVRGSVEGGGVVSATPYPWPYHGHLDFGGVAVVACLDPSWRIPGRAADESDDRLVGLATRLQSHGAIVVAVVATPVRAGCAWQPEQERSTRMLDSTLRADLVVEAGATSAFYASPLDDLLRARQRFDLVIVGWGLEGPVHSTLRAANDRGYECLLVPDACSAMDPELVVASCEMVRFSGGIFGAFTNTSNVVDALETRVHH